MDEVIKIISTLSILVPIAWNWIRLKESGLFGRIFFGFLLLGFLTDVSFWYIDASRVQTEPIYIFYVYALVEALFFFWLIWSLSISVNIRGISRFFLFCAPVGWILTLTWPMFETGKTGQSAPFVVSYEIAVSFLAGFALLALAEKEERLWNNSAFWFLLAIFFYCFCTFFVMTFLGKELVVSLWPLNNIINMVTYGLYSLGWWKFDKPVHSGP